MVQALRHGADVARRTGATLEALFCWQIVSLAPLPDSWGWMLPIDDYEKFAAQKLDAALDAAGVDLPDDRLVRNVQHVHAAKGVIEALSRAERLVLGNRGVGGFDRLLLGSVSRHARRVRALPGHGRATRGRDAPLGHPRQLRPCPTRGRQRRPPRGMMELPDRPEPR